MGFAPAQGLFPPSELPVLQSKVIFKDDFLGDVLEDGWNVQADAGGSATIVADQYGTLRLSTDGTDDDTVMAAHELNWKASQGLIFETRVKVDVVTTLGFFCGMTDAKTETSPNLPVGRSVATVTSTATDCVGFVFDTDSTSDNLFGIGVKADADTAQTGDTTPLVAGTYITLRIEISTAGAASFFINGASYGSTLANAVTTTVALTPYVGIANRGAFAHVSDWDYVYVEGARA